MAYVFNPTYIHQTVSATSKQVITAERWNELFNLLITQGDNTADAIKAFLTDLNTDGADNVGVVYNSVQMDLQSVLNLITAALAARYTSTEVNTAITVAKNGCVTSVVYDAAQGKFTINKGDGTNTVIDTTIEKIPASLTLTTEDGVTYLVVTNTDGTTTRANVSSLVDSYTFNGSACVTVTATGSGNTRTFTFSIPDGSITNAKLAAEVMSTIISYKDAAATSASAAASSASTATTKATDAASSAGAAATSATNASNSASTATTKATAANTGATNAANAATAAANSASAAASSATNASNSATAANTSKNAAATSEANAASSAATATTKATNASDSATAAANSASAAASSATNASNSATAANTSKNAAATSEANAASSAATATTKATNASDSATAAANSASAAATSEQNATSAATAAVTVHNTNLLHKQASNITQTGALANAEGDSTVASDAYAHAEGSGTTASSYAAHAEGSHTVASGECAHAEGVGTIASSDSAHAEGYFTRAAAYCHAEGYYSVAEKVDLHNVVSTINANTFMLDSIGAIEVDNKLDAVVRYPNGDIELLSTTVTVSVVDGNTITLTSAPELSNDAVVIQFKHWRGYDSGIAAHAQNIMTSAQGFAQTTIGCGNIPQGSAFSYAPTDYVFIIGNAAYDHDNDTLGERSNALTVTWAGDLWIAGNYHSADGSTGATGSFTAQDGKTVTVKNGIITAIV